MEKRFTICEAIQVKVVVMSSVLLSFCFALKKREKSTSNVASGNWLHYKKLYRKL